MNFVISNLNVENDKLNSITISFTGFSGGEKIKVRDHIMESLDEYRRKRKGLPSNNIVEEVKPKQAKAKVLFKG